jgi:uncharacterized protein YyaL (SSP411 family)
MHSSLLTFTFLATRDLLGIRPLTSDPESHLRAAEEWLKRAHDHGSDDGISYGYSIRGGWRPSYRETSGYIATTFFNLARYRSDPDYRERALRVCRWLLNVQNRDGSFSNPRFGNAGIVFDTGQDLFGLLRAFEETRDAIFMEGALRAADWLTSIADDQGRWMSNEHLGTPHVYNTRTAWALLRVNQVEHSAERERMARANLDWAVSKQQSSGFFDECAFEHGLAPFTHTIAYATRGLLESGELLKDHCYIDAAQHCADAALKHVREDGLLPGQITIDGKAAASYCCLTGNCQFAIIWAKLFDRTGNAEYQRAVISALDYVMHCQDIHTANVNVRGAIKGSQPIWGRYSPLCYPNWSTKFFVDAMLQCNRWFQ